MGTPHRRRFTTPEYSCVYDPGCFSEAQLRPLLAHAQAQLLADQYTPAGANSGTRVVDVDGVPYRLFRFDFEGVIDIIWQRLRGPLAPRSFRLAQRLIRNDLPALQPALAVVDSAGDTVRQLLLLLDRRERAEPVDSFICRQSGPARRQMIDELAELLAVMYQRGFYQVRPGSGVLLVEPDGRGRRYWLADIGALRRTRGRSPARFVRTVAHVSRRFYGHLSADERHYLLAASFDSALKRNIFSKPSQAAAFTKAVTRCMRLVL